LERTLIGRAMTAAGGNQAEAARRLGFEPRSAARPAEEVPVEDCLLTESVRILNAGDRFRAATSED